MRLPGSATHERRGRSRARCAAAAACSSGLLLLKGAAESSLIRSHPSTTLSYSSQVTG